MKLSEQQHDALAELINIAFSRTAASLSKLTGHRVILELPQAGVHRIEEITARLAPLVEREIATVHQIFSGPVAGDALLLLNYDGAVLLTNLLTNSVISSLDVSAREVLTEVGNILLNACLGMFGDLLKVRVSFSVPLLHLEDLNTLLDTLVIDSAELRYALVAHASFRVRNSAVSGYLMIVLGVTSLDVLLHELGNLG